MQKTIKKLFIAALCASVVMSSLAAVVARYDYDGGGVYFSASFKGGCSIRDYQKQSLEPRTGCDDERICAPDGNAVPNRGADRLLPAAPYDGYAAVCRDFDSLFAVSTHDGTRQKAFHMRI